MKKTKMVKLELTEIELNQMVVTLTLYQETFKDRYGMPLVASLLQRLTAIQATAREAK